MGPLLLAILWFAVSPLILFLLLAELLYPSSTQREWIDRNRPVRNVVAPPSLIRKLLLRTAAVIGLACVVVIDVETIRRFHRSHEPWTLLKLSAVGGGCAGFYLGVLSRLFADSRIQGGICGAALGIVIGWWFMALAGFLQGVIH